MTGLVPPIVADIDIGEVVGFLVFIVIFLTSIVGQIMNKAKEGKQKPPQPRPRPQPQPGRQQQGPLANEIDQFVRQAAQRRAQGGAQPAAQRQGGRPQPAPRRLAPLEQPIEAVPVQLAQSAADDESTTVPEHVRTHVASRNVDTLGSRRLESQVAQADENSEERVHEVFDHKLGQLGGKSSSETKKESAPAVPPAAAGMAVMLSGPTNIRQAIVLTEILQRPSHRWE